MSHVEWYTRQRDKDADQAAAVQPFCSNIHAIELFHFQASPLRPINTPRARTAMREWHTTTDNQRSKSAVFLGTTLVNKVAWLWQVELTPSTVFV